MKKIICLLITFALLSGCRKDKGEPEYITYDSEIFTGSDTLIYGEWKYLYSIGGIAVHKTDIGVSLLSVIPIGDYVFLFKDNTISKGKILVTGEVWNLTAIQFCNNGLNDRITAQQLISFRGSDTLVLEDSGYDLYSHYYKRIK